MCCLSTGKIIVLISLWRLNIVYCSDNTTVSPSPVTPRHRGAARQMYGSGALRPRDSHAIYATGQRHFGERSTISPNFMYNPRMNNSRKFPITELGYPITTKQVGNIPDVLSGPRPSTRSGKNILKGGLYGGRPEYYQGKPERGIIRGKYPLDLGHLYGKWRVPPDYYAQGYFKIFNPAAAKVNKLIHPSDEVLDKSDEEYEHACGSSCAYGEYLCVSSCDCIQMQSRCDGVPNCKDNEDELDCEDFEAIRSQCDEKANNLRCPHTGKCILKDWLCDGDDDCGDFSDETRCGFAKNCTSDQFECANGLCIPKTWVCDNDVDCKDFSDEWNCTDIGCNNNEFECGDNNCISIDWKCDGQIDCVDESDEAECNIDAPDCLKDEFLCTTHKCIKNTFRCDGDNDCGDWSDESNCDNPKQECETREFKCSDGKCIPDRYRCDKQQDCDNNEDESNCDYSVKRNCSSEEYTCRDGPCILRTWVCDGIQDCGGNEDELNCLIVCDESKHPCAKSYPQDNSTLFCINQKHVCDGHEDCPKGEDELNCPVRRECDRGTNCSQLCISTHTGAPACACLSGYRLANDSVSCEDINECLYATDPVCSQTCTNTLGSFKCGCMTGYVLRPDLRSCKAQGAPPTLLYANRKDIRQASLSNTKYTTVLKGLQNAIFLDYHYEKELIFWSDMSIDAIRKAVINGSNPEDVIKVGIEAPGGIAVDWIHDLIFWTDAGSQRIEVATLDGDNRAILVASDIDKPRAIAAHPGEALIFWADWGPNPKIERSEMDGKNRRRIITESIFWPNGLALDYTTDRIYWADAKHNVIESSLLDGSDRKKVVSKGLPHPFGITIFEDLIYWTDWHTKSITSASKSSGVGLRTIHSKLFFPMDIHSYHPQRQPKYSNRCNGGKSGCEHMCLPNKKSFSCVCRLAQKLDPNGKTCSKPSKFIFFARKRNLRIKHLDEDATHQHDMVIPLEGLKSVSGMAWDSAANMIFWSDVERKTINSAFWNGSNQKVIIGNNLESPVSIAYDWITRKIYWVDSVLNRIEVAEIDGRNRLLLVWENLVRPVDIVLDPYDGFLYWVTWNEIPRIERAAMDGTMRSVIIATNLTLPSGLSIDYEAKKLYWVDGDAKSISMSNLNGTQRRIVLAGNSIPHPFGLDVFGDSMYWTDLFNSTLERANKKNGKERVVIEKKSPDIMQVKIFHRTRKMIPNPCNGMNGGCSHLCLIKPQGYSCACPTGIKLKSDGKTCANGPMNYLILAHGNVIRQISLDVPYLSDVVLPLPPMKMAVSVDVDRKTGEIYWGDTAEQEIKKVKPDGSGLQTIISHEIIMPDGLCIDSTGRKIYWTDGGRNSIEVSEMDGANRKVLFATALDKPRAITLHYHHGLMFWSVWGKQPNIEVANMDGSNRNVLISTNLRWPNGLAIDRPGNRLYWNDGQLAKIESCSLNGQDRRVIARDVQFPYGLVIVGNHMYWTDWKTQALHRADKTRGDDRKIIRGNLRYLMDVRAVQSENIAENACGTNNGGCSHLCLRNPTSFSCACPTGLLFKQNSTKICETIPSTSLLVSTRFALSRISFDTPEIWDYTLPIKSIDDARDLDFHWKQKLIFYIDGEGRSIRTINMSNYADTKSIIQTTTRGIAVDWVADNIYWTDILAKKIMVAKIDGSHQKTIISDKLDDPHSVAVFPRKGYLYWTDWKDAKIERSNLDGTSRLVLINEHLSYPVGLVVDQVSKRLYWIDANPKEEKIETSNLHGQNRIVLDIEKIFPYALAQFGDFIYWTDWNDKSVYQAHKSSGKGKKVLRPNLDAAMGLTMVTQERQTGWNPCSVKNGGCRYLCFYANRSYSCDCPDSIPHCNKEPAHRVPLKCPKEQFKCPEDEDDENNDLSYYNSYNFGDEVVEHSATPRSDSFYIISLLLMVCIILLCVVLVAILLFMRGKKGYGYRHDRSFANPNYYSSNADPNAKDPAINTERKQFLWRRLKYDKSQERVYEETIGNSPEVLSLTPMLFTPSSSKCDGLTIDLDRSPSATPLQDMRETDPVI